MRSDPFRRTRPGGRVDGVGTTAVDTERDPTSRVSVYCQRDGNGGNEYSPIALLFVGLTKTYGSCKSPVGYLFSGLIEDVLEDYKEEKWSVSGVRTWESYQWNTGRLVE